MEEKVDVFQFRNLVEIFAFKGLSYKIPGFSVEDLQQDLWLKILETKDRLVGMSKPDQNKLINCTLRNHLLDLHRRYSNKKRGCDHTRSGFYEDQIVELATEVWELYSDPEVILQAKQFLAQILMWGESERWDVKQVVKQAIDPDIPEFQEELRESGELCLDFYQVAKRLNVHRQVMHRARKRLKTFLQAA